MEIRPFQEADQNSVVALWTAVFAYAAPHNDPATVIRHKLAVQRDLFFVALLDGVLVGTVMGGYDGHRGWVYSLTVAPQARRQGVGTALMHHLEGELAKRGCLKVNLQVLASNAATVVFYRKLGYAVEERVSMGKLLKPPPAERGAVDIQGHDPSGRNLANREEACMSAHTATVAWRRNGAVFTDGRYSRVHVWRFDGGLDVPASASPQVVPLPCSDAAGVDPEEAFVAALSSCHLLWFLSLAAKRGLVVESYRDEAVGILGKDAEGKLAMTRVTLRPQVLFAGPRQPTAKDIHELHHEAHEQCFIANSVKTDVRCEPVLRES